ncbi:hypothetical protein [Streptomyces rugosispiralis]|uniref:Uncharacterized protein n=1 Tax=Streptomyces rugosispiralis TaxID=2967341 RepID=A0ABT1VCD7_9ACTN|nr:hypothetical protein [Streptomyces rugosispiralis]MCQ8195055.1 hypothetical protein [Streptomyces rugosispiralis]
MNVDEILQKTDEHVRFAACLDALGRVADPDEVDLVRRVLTDPDQTMAQATSDHLFLVQRLRAWALFRAVTLNLSWSPDGLPASSNWLQLKTAAGTNTEVIGVLAEAGRTKRIRSTAKAGLTHRGRS